MIWINQKRDEIGYILNHYLPGINKKIMLRPMSAQQGTRLPEIYKIEFETRNAKFETEAPSWSDWDKKHLHHSRFVYT